MSVVDRDPVIICPYDSNHKIARSRIQRHLVKCEKNFPADFRKQCPYDATHRVPEYELVDHVKNCPMKYMYPIDFGPSTSLPSNVTMQKENEIDYDDEVWDEDLRDSSFVSSLNETFASNQQRFTVKRYNKELRPPKGYSESRMLEITDNESQSEMSDVYTFTGIGRGRDLSRACSGQYQRGTNHNYRIGIRGRLPH